MTIIATGLSNEIIGGPNAIRGGIRFKAAHSSPLAAFRAYDIDHAPGYSGGTGGTIGVRLATDIGGVPSIPIASGSRVLDPEFPDPTTGKGRFPLIAFDRQVNLVKGSWYWIIISDTDPSPTVNYYSMDYLTNATVLNQVADASVWISVGANGAWKLVPYLIPSPLVFHYANGLWQGMGWIAAPGGVLAGGAMYGFPPGSCV